VAEIMTRLPAGFALAIEGTLKSYCTVISTH